MNFCTSAVTLPTLDFAGEEIADDALLGVTVVDVAKGSDWALVTTTGGKTDKVATVASILFALAVPMALIAVEKAATPPFAVTLVTLADFVGVTNKDLGDAGDDA